MLVKERFQLSSYVLLNLLLAYNRPASDERTEVIRRQENFPEVVSKEIKISKDNFLFLKAVVFFIRNDRGIELTVYVRLFDSLCSGGH